MKKIFIMCYILISCNNKVSILYVDPNISTVFRIQKNKFETYFSDEISKKEINEKEILNEIQKLKPLNEKIEIDVRALILIKKDTISINKFYLEFRNKTYIINDKLRNTIWGVK